MPTNTTRLVAGLAALAAAVVVPSCAATTHNHDAQDSVAVSSVDVPATHVAADVTFAQSMIPHHQQAVEMTALVPDRSTNPELIKLAATIAGEQQPEIDTMKGLLSDWGTGPDAGGHAGHSMQGMVDDQTMAKLTALRGTEFDQLWLTSMIAHHRGAIDMAKAEIADGKNPDMLALARNVVTAQQAEIDQMTAMTSALASK